MRTFEYRLYVNKEQHTRLMACLIESRGIYNAMLETVKAQYEREQTFPSKYDLEEAFKGQGEHVPATTCSGYLGHPFKNMDFETEKDLPPLLANTGRSVYNQTSSYSRLMLERRYSHMMEKLLLWVVFSPLSSG